jgi:hypothetical protein
MQTKQESLPELIGGIIGCLILMAAYLSVPLLVIFCLLRMSGIV